MGVSTLFLIGQLQSLERQIERARVLREQLLRGEACVRLGLANQAERCDNDLALSAAALRLYIVNSDGLGDALSSISELSLRTVRFVVLSELSRLRHIVMTDPSNTARFACFRPPFEDLASFGAFLENAIAGLIAPWFGDRARLQADQPAFRSALRLAEEALRRLDATIELEYFLSEGAHQIDCPQLSDCCTRMRMALAVRVQVEPESAFAARALRGSAAAAPGGN